MFEVCPICKASTRVRLLPDWQDRVNVRHEPIPVVGCGNPWHYDGAGLMPEDASASAIAALPEERPRANPTGMEMA